MARKVVVTGSMKLQDYETVSTNEVKVVPIDEQATLDNDNLEQTILVEEGVGGEVRGELEINLQLLNNEDVRLNGSLRLYEGTSETSDDLDGERSFSFVIKKGKVVSFKKKVVNEEENDPDDYVRVTFTCNNLDANL